MPIDWRGSSSPLGRRRDRVGQEATSFVRKTALVDGTAVTTASAMRVAEPAMTESLDVYAPQS
jgi:hypothetical protein